MDLNKVLSMMACPKCKKPVSLRKSPQGMQSLYCDSCDTHYPIENGIICCLKKAEKVDKAREDWDQAAKIDYIKAAAAIKKEFVDSPLVKMPQLPPTEILHDKVFLDLGCGYGRTMIPCTKRGTEISVGVDISRVMLDRALELCKQYKANCILVNSDVRDIPFGDNTFDVVYSAAVILHLNRDTVKKMIHEVKRVLKPGGKAFFVGSFPNKLRLWRFPSLAMHWASLVKQYIRHYHPETKQTNVRYFTTYSQVIHLFEGFSEVNVFPSGYELLPKDIKPFRVPFRSKVKSLNEKFSKTMKLSEGKPWRRLLNPLVTNFDVEARL